MGSISAEQIRQNYPNIYLAVSPPRCCSTVFARVFWQSPEVQYYCHEPFETTYYRGDTTEVALRKILNPIDISHLCDKPKTRGGLVIKEMPYQVGENFPLLASLTQYPIAFLIRDPRLSIDSRMKKKTEVGASPLFPFIESGWELLAKQIEWCRANQKPYFLVDATKFRQYPHSVFPSVFSCFNLDFDPSYLVWPSANDVNLDNLEGDHSHLYTRVLQSTCLESPTERVPDVTEFPEDRGFRDHVAHCVEIYNSLLVKHITN
ncbi:MAG: hypothetical protein WCV93_05820 [Candidatus Shapirobacteria bacterium]|jgi:hypothetical protein